MPLPGLPFRLNGSAPGPAAVPAGVGADADAVLRSLGRTTAEIAALRRDGIVG
jgi:crotonobetainyl-CoA:carnitine CoA-transferase CaiB-like acyl-CoA transferase